MKKLLLMGFLTGILTLLGYKQIINTTEPTFEEQLEIFNQLGFVLNKGTKISDIKRWEENEFTEQPFSLMYMTLGQTIEREPWIPLTNKCWDFDTEAIEDHGSYVDIIENLKRITNGELDFKNIKDYVDIEEGKAWVSFTVDDKEYNWDMKVDNDWVDIELFSKMVKLTDTHKTKGKFTYFDTGGQNAVFGFETSEHLKEIKKKTGLNIEWLN